jgi:hypothetical protein
MKISGFTIARNIVKYNYPVKQAILSILPICDEFIVNVGDSDDGTLDLIKSINDPRIKIVQRKWDMSLSMAVLDVETDYALSQCRGDWAFYIQTDEVVHEDDLLLAKQYMAKNLKNLNVDGFQFKWLHFYGSFYRYRIDYGWYQKQIRIIRNNNMYEAHDGAWGFRRKDKKKMNVVKTPLFIYHYGWVHDPKVMAMRRKNAKDLGFFAQLTEREKQPEYNYACFDQFPIYFGRHPGVMSDIVAEHKVSNQDWQRIRTCYWWSPFVWFRPRYKTFLRNKKALEH